MRAMIVEHRNELGSLKEVDEPAVAPREVLIRVTYAGVNPVDWKIRDLYDRPKPFTLGQDFSGSIIGVGSSVTEYQQGQRVFGIARSHGSYADKTVVALDDPREPMAAIPDTVSDADAAGIPTAGLTALAAVERIAPQAGQQIAVLGASGTLGRFAVQLLTRAGAKVTAVGSASQEQAVRELGATTYLPYDRMSPQAIVDAIRQQHEGGVDAVLDAANDADGMKRYVTVLAPGALIVSTNHVTDVEFFASRGYVGEDVNLDGSSAGTHRGLRDLAKLVEQGELQVPLVAEHDLSEAVRALDDLKTHKVSGKIILSIERGDVNHTP